MDWGQMQASLVIFFLAVGLIFWTNWRELRLLSDYGHPSTGQRAGSRPQRGTSPGTMFEESLEPGLWEFRGAGSGRPFQ